MDAIDIFRANKRIVDKIINDLRDLFHFFKRRSMYNCKIYIVFALEEFLAELKANL